MLFNSLEFLIFFPSVLLLYFLLPHAYRWILLLGASCLFYMFFIPKYILILFVTIIIDYFAGIYIARNEGRRKKIWLVASIISTCVVLIVFKYFNFFIDNINTVFTVAGKPLHLRHWDIILPIGLSFHTFQSLSYVVEVYRGNQKPETHFGIYSLYVMFFPQLVAGPIERPQNILHQFYEKHQFSYANLSQGLRMMIWGFFKKVVIADNLGQIIDPVFSAPHTLNAGWLALGSALFAIQIYCDFSGYSDIAIGSAKTMGYTLMENFRFPYISQSIREFWSRWHISLSTWFRDYVYIPMGGNRVSETRKSVNLASVFALSGFWHGANWTFIIWGALHGIYLVIEGRIKNHLPPLPQTRLTRIFITAFIFVLVTIGWVFFRANSVSDALSMLYRISIWAPLQGDLPLALSNIHPYYLNFLMGVTICFLAFDVYMSKLSRNEKPAPFKQANMILNALVIALIALFGFWGKVQFIYFQF